MSLAHSLTPKGELCERCFLLSLGVSFGVCADQERWGNADGGQWTRDFQSTIVVMVVAVVVFFFTLKIVP